jgi:hypothetical protein
VQSSSVTVIPGVVEMKLWGVTSSRSKIDVSRILYVLFYVVILLTCLTFLVPDTILKWIDFSAIVNVIPKVKYDFQYLMLRQGGVVANRYVLEYILCLVLFFPVIVYSLIYAAEGAQLRLKEPLNPKVIKLGMKRLCLRFFLLVLIAYFLFLEQWVAGSGVRMSNAIYDAQFFIVYLPLVFVAFVNGAQLTAQDYYRVFHPTKHIRSDSYGEQ